MLKIFNKLFFVDTNYLRKFVIAKIWTMDNELKIVKYTDKSIALIGESKHIKDEIQALGGKPNWHLKINNEKVFGWIFPLSKQAEVEALIGQKTVIHDLYSKSIDFTPLEQKHSLINLKQYMIEHIADLRGSILQEMNVVSVVMNDTNFVPDDGKRYTFLGCGCGFSYIECDKRNKLAVKIIEDSGTIKKWVEKEMLKSIDKRFLAYLVSTGNPIQAHLAQNLNYKSAYNYLIVRYMEKFIDIKKTKVWVKNLDD